jgi:nitrite reductase (NADH) large subunit
MSQHSPAPLEKLVIIGNGMVTGRLLDELLARPSKCFDITVISAESYGSYNRIMLSSVLAKDASITSIMQKDKDWYTERNIQLICDAPVMTIDRKQKCVTTKQGMLVNYDQLVIATGSRASQIPAKNTDLKNIFLFRTIADTQAILDTAQQARSAIVVGGGLLGLEAAYGLAKSGASVTLIHRSAWLLNRQLDQTAADMLKKVMAAMGIHFYLSNEVESFNGDSVLQSATLKNGETITADLAVIATGITPNAELGLESGLQGKRAIKVNDYMQSSDHCISALGECIEHEGETFGLVDPLWRQAETLASRLADNQQQPFSNQATATKLKVSGVNVFSAGEVQTREGLRELIVQDSNNNIYRKLLIENDLIKGIVLFGDVRSGTYYFELMQAETNIAHLLPNLIFGQAFCSSEKAA